CPASVTTWMARLAPMARPLRRWAWASAGAMVATTTSVAMPLSRRRSASSSAISSNGLADSLTPSVTTPVPSGLTWMRTLKSTTRLYPTRIFIVVGFPCGGRRGGRRAVEMRQAILADTTRGRRVRAASEYPCGTCTRELVMLHPVVLSGGSGTRLWPMSRQDRPKQFLGLVGDRSLYQETVLRAVGLPGMQARITVCSEAHRFAVGEQLQAIGVASGGIVLEPVARNTAPAIALAALHAQTRDPDAVLLVMPADHLIEDEAAFREAVLKAVELAGDDWLVAFGINPDYAETGYGYIRRGEALGAAGFRIERFVEKPDLETAERYLADGGYSWNSG